jgi:enterobacterial common antigen flippase
MKSNFRATAILSGSSIVTILVGVVSAKVMAVVLKPTGYGYYGLLQSLVALSTIVAGAGMATSMVRLGAGPAKSGDHATMANLRSGAWLLFAVIAALVLLVFSAFRVSISRWTLGSPNYAGAIVLMGIALVAAVAGRLQTGILNAYHRVGALAKYGVVNAILSAAVAIAAVLLWGEKGVASAILAGSVASVAASTYYLYRDVGRPAARSSRRETVKATGSILRFGGPYMASSLVGTGVQFALPFLVLHLLDTEDVGYYRAAAAISVNYMAFLVTAMTQDYFPRVSAASKDIATLTKLINDQHRVVMLLVIPMILGTLALVPYVIPIVYSNKFAPAVVILEWMLIGDLFKFSSWTISFAILARCGSSVYLTTESIGGTVMLLSTWLGVRWFGLPGLGISFLAGYVLYYLLVLIVIRRDIHLVWTAWNKKMMFLGVAAALAVRILPAAGLGALRTPIALLLALGIGIPSLVVVWRELTGPNKTEAVAELA